MFIREVKKKLKKDGKIYDYIHHRLVESVRTKNGPRQRNILDLGTLDIPKEKHKALANLIEAFLTKNNQNSLFDESSEIIGLARHYADVIIQKRLQEESENKKTRDHEQDEKQPEQEPEYETINVNSITSSCGRTVGAEHIALTQLKELGFFDILETLSFNQKQQQYAAAQVCARMVHPASERETARWLRETSGMGELLDADFSHISDHTLHRVGDQLLTHKKTIEEQLSKNTSDLFSLDDSLILYDLTNSYFESPKRGSSLAAYGRSKEKRRDCPLVTLALVVDAHGFPKRSRIFKGNVSEPGTLWEVLKELDITDTGSKPRTIVIDAGIATEDNLKRLRADERFEYVAVSRKKKFKEDIFSGLPFKKIERSKDKELAVKTAKYGDETFLLCQSPDRALKDEAIFSRRKQNFEKGLVSLRDGLQKPHTKKGYASVLERVGRLKERYKVGNFYTVDVEQKDGKAVDIKWRFHADKKKEPGEYILRTSRKDLLDSDISMLHRTLTMIESAFRWLKSELGMRPNYHQLDKRLSSHVFISVLAYYVLAPTLNKLGWGGKYVGNSNAKEDHSPWDVPYGWHSIIETMASQTRVTTSFLCDDGERMDVRTSLEPTTIQRNIYKRVMVNPNPLKRIVIKGGAKR